MILQNDALIYTHLIQLQCFSILFQDNGSYAKKSVLKDSSSSTQEETNMSYERPKTSRGHRSAAEEHFIEEQNAPVQQEKPIMRRSNKKSVFSNANSMNESDRPSTGKMYFHITPMLS